MEQADFWDFAELKRRGVVKYRSTARRWQVALGFPAPVRLGARRVAWKAEAVRAWLAQREAQA